jgi:hypothetical protein
MREYKWNGVQSNDTTNGRSQKSIENSSRSKSLLRMTTRKISKNKRKEEYENHKTHKKERKSKGKKEEGKKKERRRSFFLSFSLLIRAIDSNEEKRPSNI